MFVLLSVLNTLNPLNAAAPLERLQYLFLMENILRDL